MAVKINKDIPKRLKQNGETFSRGDVYEPQVRGVIKLNASAELIKIGQLTDNLLKGMLFESYKSSAGTFAMSDKNGNRQAAWLNGGLAYTGYAKEIWMNKDAFELRQISSSHAKRKFGATKREKLHGKEYELTLERTIELHENPVCYICGIKVEKTNDSSNPNQLTFDRINNDLGYTNENTAVACRRCNNVKGTGTVKELHDWARRLLKNENSINRS